MRGQLSLYKQAAPGKPTLQAFYRDHREDGSCVESHNCVSKMMVGTIQADEGDFFG